MDIYDYNRKFRLRILALMLDNAWMKKFGGIIISPDYFEAEDEEEIAKAILKYREAYNKSPDAEDLIQLAGDEYSDLIEEVYDGKRWWDLSLAGDRAIEFARGQAAKLAILESIDDVNSGDYDKPIERMKKVLSVGANVLASGIDPVRDIDKWLYGGWDDKVPTGWRHVDRILEGGLSVGELGIILGPPNRGKTMALVDLGYGAASILGKKNVVHFTHEMDENKVAKRYAARMTFHFAKKNDDLDSYAEEVMIAAKKMVVGKIRVIGGAEKMGLNDIEGHLERLIAEGFIPDLIVDDYPDLLLPPRHYGDKRFELSAIYENLRALGKRFGCPVWGASQSRRESLSKEIITMEDIAEDIGKAAIADVIIAVCQTYEEEQTERCRLFMAKVRDGEKKSIIAAKYFGASQAIITTGLVKRREGKDAQM